ncbi:hypothetical protein K440DRAFT_140393 [Wilcoxina mikolae CBS 423.85]|nr:hypothetical protein K440DRAFT_140393 [Wilcoxina mikolae CBS 423.85]
MAKRKAVTKKKKSPSRVKKQQPPHRVTRSKASPRLSSPSASHPPVAPPPAAAAPTGTLAILPLEILYVIGDHLSSSALVSFALTSHHYHHLLSPLLYQRLKSSSFSWEPRKGSYSALFKSIQINALQWAASHGRSDLLKRLIVDMKVEHSPDESGRTLLARAAESGDDDTVLLLIKNARELDVKDEHVTCRVFSRCSNWRVFAIVAEEASRRLRKRGLG